MSAVLESVDLIRTLIDGLARDGVEQAGDDTLLVERLEMASRSVAPVQTSPPKPVPTSTQPLLARVGGEATLDAACEMTISRIAQTPSLEELKEIDPDRLQGAIRDGLCAAARGFGDAEHFAGQIRGLSGSLPAPEVLEALLDEIRADLSALEIPVADSAELIALVRPKSKAAVNEAPLASAPAVAAPAAPKPAAPNSVAPPAAAASETETAAAQTIRVSVDALEHMMTVVSELVLIRNQLLQLLRLEPESPFAGPLHRLNQVTSELQEGVMTTRMQPINGAWAKLPRLVRDLSQDLGKKIELVMKGQDTELDRQVLELIKDPTDAHDPQRLRSWAGTAGSAPRRGQTRNRKDHALRPPRRRRHRHRDVGQRAGAFRLAHPVQGGVLGRRNSAAGRSHVGRRRAPAHLPAGASPWRRR